MLKNLSSNPVAVIREHASALTAIIGIIAMLGTVFFGINSGIGSDPERVQGSSGDYAAPGPTEQQRLNEIHQELSYELLEARATENVSPVIRDAGLQLQAQDKAETNAVDNEEQRLDRSVAMVMVNTPLEQASGETLMNTLLDSPDHKDVIVDSAHDNYGIGVAFGSDRVWAVLIFSA